MSSLPLLEATLQEIKNTTSDYWHGGEEEKQSVIRNYEIAIAVTKDLEADAASENQTEGVEHINEHLNIKPKQEGEDSGAAHPDNTAVAPYNVSEVERLAEQFTRGLEDIKNEREHLISMFGFENGYKAALASPSKAIASNVSEVKLYQCQKCGWQGNAMPTKLLEDYCPQCKSTDLEAIAPAPCPSYENDCACDKCEAYSKEVKLKNLNK